MRSIDRDMSNDLDGP